MSIALAVRLGLEPVRTLANGFISGVYAGVGTSIDNPARAFFVQNLTNQPLMFSFNGLDDHFPLPSFGFLLLDVSSNQALTSGFYLAQGSRLYVRSLDSDPSAGDVYFTVFYGSAPI